MRILRMVCENVKRIKAVDISPKIESMFYSNMREVQMKIDESRPMRVLGSFCMGTAALTAIIAWRVAIAALSVPWVGRACTVIVIGLCDSALSPSSA